jgi:hypothetical protein
MIFCEMLQPNGAQYLNQKIILTFHNLEYPPIPGFPNAAYAKAHDAEKYYRETYRQTDRIC